MNSISTEQLSLLSHIIDLIFGAMKMENFEPLRNDRLLRAARGAQKMCSCPHGVANTSLPR